MKIEVKETVEIKLVLNITEAMWLKAMMQNPLQENETGQDQSIREDIFKSLQSYT